MPLPSAEVTRDDLLRKYRALLALRADAEPAARATLRALAVEFPGALRELDALSDDALRERLDEVERGDGGDRVAWIAAFHGLMRLVLAIKRAAPHPGTGDDARVTALAVEAASRWGAPLDVGFVRAVQRPPQGRLAVLVFAHLGGRFRRSPEHIWQALFPTARHDRFRRGSGLTGGPEALITAPNDVDDGPS